MANRDNTTLHPTVQERLDEFRVDPQNRKLYRWLRDQLRRTGHHAYLAELHEMHASVVSDSQKAAEVWVEAARSRMELKQFDRATRAFEEAVYHQPTHEFAVDTLAELYVTKERYAETADLVEDELEDLEEYAQTLQPGSQQHREIVERQAAQHRFLAALWHDHLARVDRALSHWQRSWQLDPGHTESLAAAREIYASLGDDRMVARLYESELEALGDAASADQRASIQLELGRIAARQKDMQAAAQHGESALTFDPASMPARDLLADVYTSVEMTELPGHEDRAARASTLLIELGDARLSEHDEDGGLDYLRRARAIKLDSPEAFAALERALRQTERWEELDALYVNEYQRTDNPGRQSAILRKRLRLYDDQIEDRDTLEELLVLLAGQGAPFSDAWNRLREFYQQAENWSALAKHIEAGFPALQGQPEALVKEILELSSLERERLGNRERSAQLLHHILGNIDPNNDEALTRYCDHFRERRDWRGLVDVLDFSVDSAYAAGVPPDVLIQRLEEIAEICEQRLGDIDRAIRTWNRIQQFDPQSANPAEAVRRLMSRAKMWESLVGVLEQQAAAAQNPTQRAEALRRIAQVYRERQVNPHRAIALYEEVVSLFPDDRAGLKALRDLYEREGDKAGLAKTIRRQLDLDARDMGATDVQRPGARDWPMAQRSERLTALRRLMSMYERIDDTEGVVFACTGVLEILPGDRDALDRMEQALEKAGDTARLVQTLEYHASSSSGPAERAKVLRKLARLANQEDDEMRTMGYWEQLLEAAPSDREAREKLADLYERHQRYEELASVLEKMVLPSRRGSTQTGVRRMPTDPGRTSMEQGRSQSLTGNTLVTGRIVDLPTRVRQLERYARVVDGELQDERRAVRAWEQIVELDPKHKEGLAALARIYQVRDDFTKLADIRALQATLLAERDPMGAAEALLERAVILHERLNEPEEAIAALERLLGDLDPANLDAHDILGRLYKERGDHQAAIRIAERQLYLAPDTESKIAKGMEIALLCRDQLSDRHRALQSLERVLGLDPDNTKALDAAAALYREVEDWVSYNTVLERRVELAADTGEKRRLMGEIAKVLAEKLNDPKGAFEWYQKAHQHSPDANTIAALRRTAEHHGLWQELADVYDKERSRLETQGERMNVVAYVDTCRELARIAERKLEDPKRALNVLYDAISVAPRDTQLLAEAEKLATDASRADDPPSSDTSADATSADATGADATGPDATGPDAATRERPRTDHQRALFKLFLECVDAAIAGNDRDAKVALHIRKARILEAELDDAGNAFEELLQAFAWAPEREQTRALMYELAERRGEWNDVVAVESALLERAVQTRARLQVLGRKAAVLEVKLNERVRAFRTYLIAFLLAPENKEVLENLWRLAREIGPAYQPSDRTPRSEPPAAYVHPHDSGRMRAAPSRSLPNPAGGNQVLEIRSSKPMRADQTMDLSLGDLRALPAQSAAPVGPVRAQTDVTEQIDLNDIEIEETVDIDVEGDDDEFENTDSTIELSIEDLMVPPSVKRPPAPKPPGLPGLPGVPGSSRRPPPPPPPPPPVQRKPIPHMPVRAYDSPWEELAVAYEQLPASTDRARQRILFHIAEIWENGAGNVNRAFNTLARALDFPDIDDGEARARLNRLAEEHDAWDNLAELYETAAEEAKTGDRAIDLLMDVAEIHAHRNRFLQTEAIYRRVLGMRPDDALARERLESLYRSEERWVELCASLEERTNPRLGTAAPERERPALLRELADVYRHKLNRPHDAIDALHRLRELQSEDVDILREIAELYGDIGRWSKVITMLQRVSEVAEGTPAARDALRRIGEIYENQLELPDRAIVAYSELVAAWPEDTDGYQALDTLYEAHSRWQELAHVLGRRASLSRDPEERSTLLRRRANVLMDQLSGFEDAASALRHARTLTPDAPGLGDELVRALVGAGRAREAAAVLQGRIAGLEDNHGRLRHADDLAALYVRLATIRADQLEDVATAKTDLERALELVPALPAALATMARIVESQEDPRTYAEAKLREAEVLDDTEAKVESLMKAGLALRDRCGDAAAAREAFEQILQVSPHDPAATWALAGLIEQEGDLAGAAKVLENRLGAPGIEASEKARIKTQMASLARRSEDIDAAESFLAEALEADPNHGPAVLARADLLDEHERWDELAVFLQVTIPDLEGVDDATLAELYRRRAIALERLERDEEAYEVLVEADRLHRGSLLVKLALGENRYRAHRWREAALHLSSLAVHVDAAKYPTEVAEGLYHAALAEIRALRPEKAKGLYERALDIKPNYAPALHAMAETAMEEGDHERAADLLTRQAAATEEPNERVRLFEALGDMSLETLGDFRRALMCYEQAVNSAAPLGPEHMALLIKLLHRQEAVEDHRGVARTSERLAEFADGPEEAAAYFSAAAESYIAAGDHEQALTAVLRGVDADPYDLMAVNIASELLMNKRDHERAAALLGRALSGPDTGTDNEYVAARKATLWNRLAHARLSRGDTKGATTAFDKSVQMASNSDAAMDSRRQLLRLWKDEPEKRKTLLAFRRIIAADSMAMADVVNYARALCRAKHDDGGRAILELSEAMGHRMGPLDIAFLERRPVYQMAVDEAYQHGLGEDDYRALVLARARDEREDRLATLLSTLWEAASALWPEPGESLERCGVLNAERVPGSSDLAARAIFPNIVNALDLPASVLYTTDMPDAPDVQVVCVAAPVVVVGPRLQVPVGWQDEEPGPEVPTEAELRFLLTRAAEMTRPAHIQAAGMPYPEFVNRVASVLRSFGPEEVHNAVPTEIQDEDVQRAHDEMLRGDIPVKLRTRLEELLEGAKAHEFDVTRYYARLDRAADRAGLLLCGDMGTAVKHAGTMTSDGRRVTRHLFEAALHPRYLKARARLGVGVRHSE